VVHPRQEPCRRNLEVVPLIRAGRVVEVGLQVAAESVQVRCEDPRDIAAGGLRAVVGQKCGSRLRLTIVLEAAEEEQAVPDNRSTESDSDVVVLERARIEGDWACTGADEAVVAPIVKHRTAELVGAALRDHVDAITLEM